MTFSKLLTILARDGHLPASGRPAPSLIVPSAEGRPHRAPGIDVRAPKPITPEQAAWLRARGPA